MKAKETNSRPQYQPGIFDNLFLNLFRNKMVLEVGWDSEKPGYDGLIEVANRLVMGRSNSETKDAAVRILRSLFPPLLLELYRMLIAPIGGGKVAALMVGKLMILAVILRTHFVLPSFQTYYCVSCAIGYESSINTFDVYDLFALFSEARVTALSCQWLMGSCKVNSVNLPNGSSWMSGVFVERCKYLEESKCVGICINTCKLPTQTFFKDCMGVPLLMEPNFSDYSCQFNFGVLPPLPKDDSTLKEPCLEICPNARRRKEITSNLEALKCPKS